jgi:DNA-binding transcriptional MerR regulator
MDARWTLDELCERVEAVLADEGPGTVNGRVREVPDRRTVRYYTTLGLIDRPAELRGRTAYYGRKHLLQLVAIKRLQARGLALADVQQRLLGLGENELAPLAQLPDGVAPPAPALPNTADQREAETFWRTLPSPPAAPAPSSEPASWGLRTVDLGPGAALTLVAARPLRPEDEAAIRAAAGPLLDLLRTRGLLAGSGPGDDTAT